MGARRGSVWPATKKISFFHRILAARSKALLRTADRWNERSKVSFGVWRLVPVLAALSAPVMAEVAVANQTVSVTLQPQGKVSVPSGLTLLKGAQAFAPYAGTMTVSFRARTTLATSATVTLQAGGNFIPSGGPSLAAGDLTFTCGAAGYGTACSGIQTVSSTAQRTVVILPPGACSGGGGSCSAADPATVQVSFQLSNDPSVSTGTYSLPVVFTVSSL